MDLTTFRTATCDANACWTHRSFTDGGLSIDLGQGWHALMLDEHFANKHKCFGSKGKGSAGEYCDAIAVHEQASNKTIRFIEAKTDGSVAHAVPQLQKGADYVDALTVVPADTQFTAEIHARSARTTARLKERIRVGSKRVSVVIKHTA